MSLFSGKFMLGAKVVCSMCALGVSTIALVIYVNKKREERFAFDSIMSQYETIPLPVSSEAFVDMYENCSEAIGVIEEKHRVRVRFSNTTDSYCLEVSGFKPQTQAAGKEIKIIIDSVSEVISTELKIPSKLYQTLNLSDVLGQISQSNKGLAKISSQDDIYSTIICFGTKSQISAAKETIFSVIAEHYKSYSIAQPKTLTKGTHYEVYVSAIRSPSKFWVQIIDENVHGLDDLQDQLGDLSFDLEPCAPELTQVYCAAPFHGVLYRAFVLDHSPDQDFEKMCKVEFIDYGDETVVSRTELRELTEDLCKLPAQAVKCSLVGTHSDMTWSRDSVEVFERLCFLNEWQPVKLVVIEEATQTSPCIVSLFNKSSNLEITTNLL